MNKKHQVALLAATFWAKERVGSTQLASHVFGMEFAQAYQACLDGMIFNESRFPLLTKWQRIKRWFGK